MTPSEWHSRYGGIEWCVTPHGVETRADGLLRTPGEPITMRRYFGAWRLLLEALSAETGVPVAVLLMTIATENGAARLVDGRVYVTGAREEPGWTSDAKTPHRVSVGPCHILLSNARLILRRPQLTREELRDPATNLRAAALHIRGTRKQTAPGGVYDPILVAACYNAGGLYDSRNSRRAEFRNRWNLRSWTNHLDRAARWYGDACAVLAEHTRTEG